MKSQLVPIHLICLIVVSSGHFIEDAGPSRPDYGKRKNEEVWKTLVKGEAEQVTLKQNVGIVGGNLAAPHSRPWQVLVLSDGNEICSGAIIHPEWVVTAAQCKVRATMSSITIVAGTNQWCVDTDAGREVKFGDGAEIRKVIRAIDPIFHEPSKRNDIALFKLDTPLPMNSNIQAIPLATKDVPENEVLEVSGWGSVRNGENTTCELRTLSLPKYNDDACRNVFELDYTQFCAGFSFGGGDFCKGDTGSPLVKLLGGSTAILYGIASYNSDELCAQRFSPGIYSRVVFWNEWIQETIRTTTL